MARTFKNKKEVQSFYKGRMEAAKERYKKKKGLKIARGFNKSPAFNAINYWRERKLLETGVERAKSNPDISLTDDIDPAFWWVNFGVGGLIDQKLKAYYTVYDNFGIIIHDEIFGDGQRKILDYSRFQTEQGRLIDLFSDMNSETGIPLVGALFYEDSRNNAYAVIDITL